MILEVAGFAHISSPVSSAPVERLVLWWKCLGLRDADSHVSAEVFEKLMFVRSNGHLSCSCNLFKLLHI